MLEDEASGVGCELLDIRKADAEAVADYEAKNSGLRRPAAFIESFFSQPGAVGFIMRNQTSKDIVAMGAIRPSSDGFRIGPLYANNSTSARIIVKALMSHTFSATVYIDVPLDNQDAVEMVQELDFTVISGFETARMWTKGVPINPIGVANVYGLFSLEIG